MEITDYPHFVEINAKHKSQIENITKNILPYCDFTFSNLYIWEVDECKTQVSLLNNNLVVKNKNIHSHEIEISFIGTNRITETIDTLISDHEEIKLFPHDMLLEAKLRDISLIEDTDNHDYVLSTRALAELKGRQFLSKRKRVNKFKRKHQTHEVKVLDKSNKSQLFLQILEVYKSWEISKKGKINQVDLVTELTAIRNLIDIVEGENIEIWALFIEGTIKAFTTLEYINSEYAVSSFAKADLTFEDANTYLTHITSKYLFEEKNIKYINHEQDLGLLNLRIEKLSWKPNHLLKKYKIKKYD